jgi:hypothetical protein
MTFHTFPNTRLIAVTLVIMKDLGLIYPFWPYIALARPHGSSLITLACPAIFQHWRYRFNPYQSSGRAQGQEIPTGLSGAIGRILFFRKKHFNVSHCDFLRKIWTI